MCTNPNIVEVASLIGEPSRITILLHHISGTLGAALTRRLFELRSD